MEALGHQTAQGQETSPELGAETVFMQMRESGRGLETFLGGDGLCHLAEVSPFQKTKELLKGQSHNGEQERGMVVAWGSLLYFHSGIVLCPETPPVHSVATLGLNSSFFASAP